MECATSASAECGICNNKSQSPLTNEVGQGRAGHWEGEKIEKLFLALGLAFGFFFFSFLLWNEHIIVSTE